MCKPTIPSLAGAGSPAPRRDGLARLVGPGISRNVRAMGGQGMIPEDGEGGIVEGSKEAQRRQLDTPGGAAPRAGMQGKKERGAAPTPILERPGTTPAGTPGS